MRATWTILIALILIAIPVTGFAQEVEEVQPQPPMEVKEIEVKGNRLVPLKEIMEAIEFKQGDPVTEEELSSSAQRILELGYFQQVIPDYIKVEDGIKVIYEVVENPVVKEIEIAGNELYGGPINLFGLKIPFGSPILKTERILEILQEQGVEPGKILNVKKLQDGLRAIIEAYQEKGYTLITIDIEDIKIGPTLFIPIIESKVERVEIEGLDVPQGVERAKSLIKIPLGQPVKIDSIQNSFRQISHSIYFEKMDLSDLSFDQGSESDKVILFWNLKPRRLIDEPTEVERIEFVGNTVYSEEQLIETVGALPEEEVSNFQLLQSLEGIYSLYQEDGYTMVELSNEGLGEGVLTIGISEGVISKIKIRGNERTKDYVILRQLRLKPGDIFNENPLRESYLNLSKLGYFEGIDIGFEEGEVRGEGDLVLNVIEKGRLGSFNGALTYAEGGLVGKLSLSWKNLFGTGQDISLGYDRGLIGKEQANWHIDYNTSSFFPTYDFFKVSLYQETESGEEEGQDGEYTLNKGGIESSLGYPWGSNTLLSLSQRYEGFQKCFEGAEGCEAPGTTSSITVGLINDDRNNADFPTEGGIRSLSLEQAGAFTAGTRFTKLSFTLVQHLSTLDDQNLALRFYGGQGFSLPSQERFNLGGISTIRGIPIFSVDKLFLINAEYRVLLTAGAVGVAFADLGFDEEMEIHRSFGLELRAQLPAVGPVRLVFAWPVIDGRIDWQPKIDFGFGSMF